MKADIALTPVYYRIVKKITWHLKKIVTKTTKMKKPESSRAPLTGEPVTNSPQKVRKKGLKKGD